MPIPVWSSQTGNVWVRDFDLGMINALGASVDLSDANNPTYAIYLNGPTENKIPVYFNQPEMIYKNRKAPSILIQRDEITPALNRYMGVGQLEYRAPVYIGGTVTNPVNSTSGYAQYVSKPQAMPYDFTYTVMAFDRYEQNVQPIVKQVLKSFPPLGKIFVTDSLGLLRSYDARSEGPIPSPRENLDPVNRFVSYSVSVKVDGEIDLTDPVVSNAASGIVLNLHRF